MSKLLREFISLEKRMFDFKVGEQVASSLSGFVAGVIVASIIWGAAVFIFLKILNI